MGQDYGEDTAYAAVDEVLTFAQADTTQTLPIFINNDNSLDSSCLETFSLMINQIDNAPAGSNGDTTEFAIIDSQSSK